MNKILATLACLILLNGCASKPKYNNYKITEESVSWIKLGGFYPNYREINVSLASADAKTFKVLTDKAFGVDTKFVYYKGKKLVKAQPASFKLIDKSYSNDSEMVFYKGVPIPLAEAKSFTIIDDELAKDAHRLYFNGLPLSGSIPEQYKFIHQSQFHTYIRSGERLYYGNKLVSACDIDTFQVNQTLNNRAQDKKCAYYFGTALPGADLESFTLVKGNFSKDKHTVFFGSDVLQDADAASFVYENKKYRDQYSCFSGALRKNCADGSDFSLSSIKSEKALNKAAWKIAKSWIKQDKNRAEARYKKLNITQDSIVQSLQGNVLTPKISTQLDFSWLPKKFHIQLSPTLSTFKSKRLYYNYSNTGMNENAIQLSIFTEQKNQLELRDYALNGQLQRVVELPHSNYKNKDYPKGNCRFTLGECSFVQHNQNKNTRLTVKTLYKKGVWIVEDLTNSKYKKTNYFIYDKKGIPVYFAQVINNSLRKEYTRNYIDPI
jgi:hypothetical protein